MMQHGCNYDAPPVCAYKFTGKERDTESSLDMFGARYYASTMGRFMTPDWAGKPIDVPYADFANPQSLNLYGYVRNNPTTTRDPDGHCGDAIVCGAEFGGAIGSFIEPGGGTAVGATAGIVVGAVVDAGLAGYLLYKHFSSSDNSKNAPAK
jgi:RHS repeat-associated protein